jgi:CheY-like chemotaxis protein
MEPTLDLEAQAVPVARPSILLAEDNEANIVAISDYLNVKGYQVVVARNGTEAVTRAREIEPAVILMDIQMPGMDGLEATRRIRTQDRLSQTPIIALTALAMPGDRERCLAAGANDYLSKPVSLKGLAAAIEAQLQRHITTSENTL